MRFVFIAIFATIFVIIAAVLALIIGAVIHPKEVLFGEYKYNKEDNYEYDKLYGNSQIL